MGVVYRAEPAAAIKILNVRRATMQPDLVRRFEVEAQAAMRLTSPHIARVFASGTTDEGHLYIAMELLYGAPLDAIIRRAPRIAPEGVAAIAHQVAHALGEAHDKHIVHRDLKPSNLYVEPVRGGGTHIRVLDFGVARINTASVARSRTGTVTGTPAYMAPEQLRGRSDIDGRADIYTLGVVMYQLLTGANPFESEGNLIETLRRHLEDGPPPLPPHVPRALALLVSDMLAKDRAHRPPTMHSVRARLDASGLVHAPTDDDEPTVAIPGILSDTVRAIDPTIESLPDTAGLQSPPTVAIIHRPRASRTALLGMAVAVTIVTASVTATILWLRNRSPSVDVSAPDGLTNSPPFERTPVRGRPIVAEVIEADAAPPIDAMVPPPPPPLKKARAPRRPAVRERTHDRLLRDLLRRGATALENGHFSQALESYEAFLEAARDAHPPHPQYEVVRNRVRVLRDTR